jgi:hypothetical protein
MIAARIRSISLAAGALYAALSSPASASPSFTGVSEIYRAVAGARYAIVTAYTLPTRGGMTAALESLCRRGGRGDVILAGDQFIVGSSVRRNVDEVAQQLTQAGCSVRRATQPLHLKLAFVDGESYLADRNWGRSATVLHFEDQADRDLIAATLRNAPGNNGVLATRKAEALKLEAEAITQSSGPLMVETESFGDNNPVYNAIAAALEQHRPVSLIVASAELRSGGRSGGEGGEAAALGRLLLIAASAKTPFVVREGSSNAKMALGAFGTAWIGSTNATAGYPEQIDWGRQVREPLIRLELARRYAIDWADAAPLGQTGTRRDYRATTSTGSVLNSSMAHTLTAGAMLLSLAAISHRHRYVPMWRRLLKSGTRR